MLPVVTSIIVIGTLLVDCIGGVVPVLDFENDVSSFGVKEEAEISAPFVVLVPTNKMFVVV